jgi:phosphatidylserine/phosphatidylglycerophosphate/cardiolipin synthase-like enzyme
MSKITSGSAWANNEVAYIAWDTDGKIAGCLGFEVTRVYLDAAGNVAKRSDGKDDRVKCAAWVSFKGQRNPEWIAQDTGVWPVQKFSWRDLTLRKKRSGMTRRPDEVSVRFEIRPVGDMKAGLTPVPSNGIEKATVIKRDKKGKPILGADGKPVMVLIDAYTGAPRPLGYLAPAFVTNALTVTSKRPPFRSTFTNGILAAQWLTNVLNEDGTIEKDELLKKIENPSDPHRKYLAGDVLPLLHELFARPGTFRLALYELEDKELEDLIIANKDRVEVILANSAADDKGAWDARNAPARTRVRAALGARLQDRMFNNTIHIGHNKFVVHIDPTGTAQSVFTGSTNWTSTGVAGQTNNALLVEDKTVAKFFFDYWKRMHDDDKLPKPKPKLSSTMKDTQQGLPFRKANETTSVVPIGNGAEIHTWFSPNRPERKKPTSKLHPAPVPPDLQEVYRRMRLAREAIIFLAFYPGQKGVDCIIGEAIDIGRKDSKLIVVGAVSSPQAMPNYVASKKDKDTGEVEVEGDSPTTFEEANVAIVRAARIDEKTMLGDLGVEQLTAKGGIGAIIHDKIVVIDPLSANCSVILGSHNLGFKASYSNDENMVIVTRHRELAMAYAVHVLDVYDHYRFRAIENDRKKEGGKGWSGFLDVDDRWQDAYVAGTKGALSRYFARG